ncbi:MAG: hypothetical protein Q7S06_03530 [Nanoarchaeota archaeon]|nr:hypothetical protein [Nanoarchaeota archaeon]
MLQKNSESFSDSFKKIFLIEFTKELIKNSAPIIEIQNRKPQINKKTFRIPEPILPPKFQYLHPYPVPKEIDLGRLNPLIKDSMVRVIECNGEDEPVIVEGTMGRKTTKIVLNKGEIDEIIKRFSEEGKIPVRHGIYRIVVGKLIFSAIISEIVSTKFMIKKMV